MEHILRQPEGKGFTFGEMLSNSATLIQAGSETTATLLSGAVFLLCKYPETYKLLMEELTNAFESEDQLTIENTTRLPYMDAVLEEALRCYSPAVPGFPRQVPQSGATIDGQWVPGGVCVPSCLSDRPCHKLTCANRCP
jgi:cytochrome P450